MPTPEIVSQPKDTVLEETKSSEKTEEAAVLLDFSNTFKDGTRGFKKKANKKALPKPQEGEEAPTQAAQSDVNKDLEDANFGAQSDAATIEIPRNLKITQEQMMVRKQLDIRRWLCMARPQHPKSCGISSLTSVWNFLFSTLGAGKHRAISTEEALEVLGFKPPYTNFDFGSFTGNDTLIQWFALLCKFYHVKGGKAQILWKPRGKSQTSDSLSEATAHARLVEGLRSETKAYIYHCWNHYFCPIGFDLTPVNPMDAYAPLSDEMQTETWVIIGEVSKCYPCFHTKRWSDIVTDLTTGYPEFFNIRKSELGIQRKESQIFQEGGAKHGGNLHCLIEFECDQEQI